MSRRLHVLLAAAFALCGAPALAQTAEDEQAWVNATVMGPISGDLVYFAEAQPRFSNGASRLDQLLLRPAIGWRLSPAMTVYQGYARVFTRRQGLPDFKEHRSFQQLSWVMGKPWGGEFSTRSRLEQRWRADGEDMGWRARVMGRLEGPVKAGGKVAPLVWAEAFIALNDTDWGARSGFDQLRSFAGAEVNVGGRSTLEIGYLNQFINQPAGRSRMNHVASLTLFVRH